jgi:hypothetical protein
LRIRTSSITSRCCFGFSFVGDGCFRAAGLAGGEERRPAAAGALTGGDATAAAAAAALGAGGEATAAGALTGGEATAAGAALGGGEVEAAPAGFGLRRRRGFAGDGVKASRCMRLVSGSWDLRTAVAMAADESEEELVERRGEEIWERRRLRNQGKRRGLLQGQGGEVRLPPRRLTLT